MTELKMKIGPKGQLVIPKDLREEFGISPGDHVIVHDNPDGILVRKLREDSVKVFEKIAKSGPKVGKVNLHSIEEEIEERWRRSK